MSTYLPIFHPTLLAFATLMALQEKLGKTCSIMDDRNWYTFLLASSWLALMEGFFTLVLISVKVFRKFYH